jgi:hypothetical protein
MSRKPDIHRVLSRYADLNPPLGYPGGSCHLQDRIRQEVRSTRNQGILLDHHLSGADKRPSDRHERAIYDVLDEGRVRGTSFGDVRISEHAQYRMDQKGITVADLRQALREFQKEWVKELSDGYGPLMRGMADPNHEFSFDSKSARIRVYLRPLQVWEPGNQLRVWIRTVHPLGNSSVGNPVPPEECGSFKGWSREYPEQGFERLFPKKASGTGDCYEANGRYFMDHGLFGGDGNMRLVHGEVTGQGPLEGVNYGHAWVEDGNTVIDVSNGRNTRMPKAVYYALGNIEQNDNIHKYTASEFRRKVSQYKHWGPWDLRTSTGL